MVRYQEIVWENVRVFGVLWISQTSHHFVCLRLSQPLFRCCGRGKYKLVRRVCVCDVQTRLLIRVEQEIDPKSGSFLKME